MISSKLLVLFKHLYHTRLISTLVDRGHENSSFQKSIMGSLVYALDPGSHALVSPLANRYNNSLWLSNDIYVNSQPWCWFFYAWPYEKTISFYFLLKMDFCTLYSDYGFPAPNSSHILPTSPLIQIHTSSCTLSLENTQVSKKNKR